MYGNKKWYNRRGGFIPGSGYIRKPKGKLPPSNFGPNRRPTFKFPDNGYLPGRRPGHPYGNFEPIGGKGTGRRPGWNNPNARLPATQTQPQRKGVRTKKRVKTDTDDRPIIVGGPIDVRRRPASRKPKRGGDIDSKRIYPIAAGSTYSTVKLRVPMRIRMKSWPRGFKSLTAPQKVYTITSNRTDTFVGKQNVYVYNSGNAAFWSLLSNAISTNNTTQFIAKDAVTTFSMTNASNCNMFIEIWDCYYRRNTSNSASALFQNGLIDEGGDTNSVYQWGMDPLQSLSFRTMCKVKAVRRVELGEGRSHQHRVYTAYNSRWTQEEYNNNTTTYLDGWSRFTMFIIRGAAVNSQASYLNVSTGKVGLDIIAEHKCTYTYISPTSQTISITNALPVFTDAELLNVATGEADVDETV